jgi:hypothetical protein
LATWHIELQYTISPEYGRAKKIIQLLEVYEHIQHQLPMAIAHLALRQYEPEIGPSGILWSGLLRHNVTNSLLSFITVANNNIYNFSGKRILDRGNNHTGPGNAIRAATLCSNASVSWRRIHVSADSRRFFEDEDLLGIFLSENDAKMKERLSCR